MHRPCPCPGRNAARRALITDTFARTSAEPFAAMSSSVVPVALSPRRNVAGCWPGLQRTLFELRREAQAAGAVERLRLRGRARELGVRERGHETRNGKQRRDEPPSAWQCVTLGNRFGKLSWRHVWVAVRSRLRPRALMPLARVAPAAHRIRSHER